MVYHVRTTNGGLTPFFSKIHPDPHVRRRFAWEARDLSTIYPAVVAAARPYCRDSSY